MDNQTFQRIKDLITQHQAVGIVVKPNPTLDEMAAGLGMYLVLTQMGKAASIASPTDTVVDISNLVGIQKVGKILGGATSKGGNLTVSFPYKDGEIEKVSYTQENGALNILVQAGPNGLSFSQNDVKFIQSGGAMPTLLFAIGVPNLNDIAAVVSPDGVRSMTVVNIDNKAENTKYGDVVVVSNRFSSVSEQVADFLTLLEPQIELDKDTSQNLFDGISSATKDYTAPNTSYLAFEMAGILMKKGATRYKAPGASVPQGQPANQYFPPMNTVSAPMQQQVSQSQPVQPQQPMQSFGNTQGQQFTPMPIQQPQVQSFSPVQNPSVQPVPQFNPAPNSFQGQQVQAAVQDTQPIQNKPATQAPQQNFDQAASATSGQAPADWLTPKVYKGSSIL